MSVCMYVYACMCVYTCFVQRIYFAGVCGCFVCVCDHKCEYVCMFVCLLFMFPAC